MPRTHETRDGTLRLGCQRLDVYRVAVRFYGLVPSLVKGAAYGLRDQLERASYSIVLNIAEASGRKHVGDRRRFFSIARGSAYECAAVPDLLLVRECIDQVQWEEAQRLLVRSVQMLTKLALPRPVAG